MKHRCAVCWAEQRTHDEWYEHATEAHDASLIEFGFDRCTYDPRNCVGVKHARTLRTEGVVRPRTRPEPQPFKARDGTVYTPVPLFEDRSA